MTHTQTLYGLCDCGRYRTDPNAPDCPKCGKTYATNSGFAPPEVSWSEWLDLLAKNVRAESDVLFQKGCDSSFGMRTANDAACLVMQHLAKAIERTQESKSNGLISHAEGNSYGK